MTICSHCGRQSQENALTCQFCGFPLAAEESDISGQETIYSAPALTQDQNGVEPTIAAQPNEGALAKVAVHMLQGSGDQSRDFALTGQTVSIGRSPSCEIVLDNDQLTSRRHALLRYDGTQYTVVDLGSSNGTFVNNTEIRDATPLNNGDRIIVGEHELVFSTDVGSAARVAAVDMDGAPPSSPLGITGALPAVNPGQQASEQPVPVAAGHADGSSNGNANIDEADTTYMATVMAPMDTSAAVADASATADVSSVSDVSDVADIADMPTNTSNTSNMSNMSNANATDIADMPTQVSDVIAETGADSAPTSDEAESATSETLLPPSTPDSAQALMARAPSSGALRQPGGELDQLRAQLAQLTATSEAVAQHAAEETDLSEQRRQALAETRDQIHAILAGIQNASSQPSESTADEPGDLTDLIALTKRTADDPNHLQNVSRMAEHANEIARALEALQARRIQPPKSSASETALAELRALQARLDELA
jgi:pSer/pThr/pTyr-binding forkhead associated (FHA) protein